MAGQSASKDRLKSGHYAREQLFSKDALIAWSHQSRFRVARKILKPHASGKLLDYGCGDGTFLELNRDLFSESVGAGIDPKEIQLCRERFKAVENLKFELIRDLMSTGKTFDVITCMEVIEHCTEDKAAEVLQNLSKLLSAKGYLLISVPNETGPSLAIKQAIRTAAGWRGIGDYKYTEQYTPKELLKMVFAGDHTEIKRPVYGGGENAGSSIPYHGHKGFNWRVTRKKIEQIFKIEEIRFSPLGVLNGAFSSQVFFLCRKKG